MTVVINMAPISKWQMVQMDDGYGTPPPGTDTSKDKAWKIYKCIYGLQQASHIWHATLADVCIGAGLNESAVDPCLFFRAAILLAVYFDFDYYRQR